MYFLEQAEVRVRTLRPIAAGEEIFIAYLDTNKDRMVRREDLKMHFSFRASVSHHHGAFLTSTLLTVM